MAREMDNADPGLPELPDMPDPDVGAGVTVARRHTTPVSRERQALLIEGKYTFVASDYYGDCTKSSLAVAVVALSQCSLLIFYVLGLDIGGAPDFSNGRVFSFYYAGWRSMYAFACVCGAPRQVHEHMCTCTHARV